MAILKTSDRKPMPGATYVSTADPLERLEVTVILKGHTNLPKTATSKALKAIDHRTFTRQYGAKTKDFDPIRTFARRAGLGLAHEHLPSRTAILSGTVKDFSSAFGVRLHRFDYHGGKYYPDGTYRGRSGKINLPAELAGKVDAVMGLDNRPQAFPFFQLKQGIDNYPGFTPMQVANLYDFPEGDGRGQCIGLIELGGGYQIDDLRTYFHRLEMKVPKLCLISVDHAKNVSSGCPTGVDGEVMLDIEIAHAIAPAAKIVVYLTTNSDAGFYNAVTRAIHDFNNRPSVLSISWGCAESMWTPQAMIAMDNAFQDAARLGITICVSSGDAGATGGIPGVRSHAVFPASSPHVLACGGSTLHADRGQITAEGVWSSQWGQTGGGVSKLFRRPQWQRGLKITTVDGRRRELAFRGIPDVCGDGDPETGFRFRANRFDGVVAGTSAVAPLWAALIARINSTTNRRLGFLNPHLYANRQAFRDVTSGSNGAYLAGSGWDACTGLGSPHGTRLQKSIRSAKR